MGQQKSNPAQVSFNGHNGHGVLYQSVWGMDVDGNGNLVFRVSGVLTAHG